MSTEQMLNFKVVFNRSCCHGNYENANFTCQSKSFISIFFSCQVSAFKLQPFSCHDLANDIYSKTAKTVFSHLKSWHVKEEGIQGRDDRSSGCGIVVQKEPYCGIRVPYPGRP